MKDYREQDGCWNCKYSKVGEYIWCGLAESLNEVSQGCEEWGICDDYKKVTE